MCGDPRKLFSRRISHNEPSLPPLLATKASARPTTFGAGASTHIPAYSPTEPSTRRSVSSSFWASHSPSRSSVARVSPHPAASSGVGASACRPHPGSPSSSLPQVQKILSARSKFNEFYRPWKKPDTPLSTVYRIYVAVLCGRHLTVRNEVEHFWNTHQWRVCDIPEPNVSNKEQLAVLAATTYLLVKAFNHLIGLGVPRDAPAIMSDKLMEELKSKPKVFETVPDWAALVEPLKNPLFIPDSGGRGPLNSRSQDIDSEMRRKNILTFTLPVLFA
jgi:hypothetical protein